ncbi:hypothetical protein [Streptomyces sp. DH8]|uniref:hypothetical protein n=1 Tax=Streptomyces sp. DH8 TaxID=2857008 RepID=UPI001E3A388D|nr:hypothetical protein [Streptomyces sp. DH8]
MTPARVTMFTLYAVACCAAAYTGAAAVEQDQALNAVVLFGAAAVMLVAIRREAAHAVLLVRTVTAIRHGLPLPGRADDIARIEKATALPSRCVCEAWWTTLGTRHDRRCPALLTKELR